MVVRVRCRLKVSRKEQTRSIMPTRFSIVAGREHPRMGRPKPAWTVFLVVVVVVQLSPEVEKY